MQSRSARTGALAQEREKEVEEGRKNLRNAPHSAARNTPSAPQVRKSSVVALVLISLVLLQFGLFATWSQLTRQPGNSKSQKCGIIVREYEIESLAQIDQLSPQVRYTWDLLDCNTWLQAAPGRFADASPGLAAGKTRNATDETEAPPYTCPAPCADSWSFGEWVQWCPPYAHKSKSCGYNFVLPNQQCMFHWFDRKETAQCMKNNWIMVLGSSGAMNLGLTWLMALDPEGTKEPFYGPRWYNKTCWHNKSVPCEKNWLKPKDLSFVNFQTMAYDLIMDSNGKVVYKASSKFDDKELPHLSQAPVVPPGGWRLTVQPVQYAHEVVTKVHKAIAPESWKGSMPIVYAQVGQWYLNAFDGRSRQWGLNTSEVAALERLREPRQLFEVYYDDVLWMVESLQQLNVQAIALGTMPVSKHRCRKREGLGCRTGLNSMIDLVLQHQTSIANEQEKSGKMAPVFAVDWASVSVGEQGGAHTDHKGALLVRAHLCVILVITCTACARLDTTKLTCRAPHRVSNASSP